jgi:hypothetical protein
MPLYAQPQANAAAPATDQAEGPSLADVAELCVKFECHIDSDDDYSFGILRDMNNAAITRWRAPVAQPAAKPVNLAELPEPDFRAALKQLADAVDGWEMQPVVDDPLAIAMDHARKVLKAGERLSSGKLVSERLDELLTEVQQKDLEPAEVILGSRAFRLYCKERHLYAPARRLHGGYHGLPVTKSDSEAAEYVAIEYQQ